MTIAPFTGEATHDVYCRTPGTIDLWHTIGWITSPSVILEHLRTGERMTVVIGSLQANEFVRLVPEVKK